jgi:hypothetical protein
MPPPHPAALDDGHARSAPREVVGRRGADDAGADDEDIHPGPNSSLGTRRGPARALPRGISGRGLRRRSLLQRNDLSRRLRRVLRRRGLRRRNGRRCRLSRWRLRGRRALTDDEVDRRIRRGVIAGGAGLPDDGAGRSLMRWGGRPGGVRRRHEGPAVTRRTVAPRATAGGPLTRPAGARAAAPGSGSTAVFAPRPRSPRSGGPYGGNQSCGIRHPSAACSPSPGGGYRRRCASAAGRRGRCGRAASQGCRTSRGHAADRVGQNSSGMRFPKGFSERAVGAAFLAGLVADLLVPDTGVSAALTRVLGVSSIGLALWMLARIAR